MPRTLGHYIIEDNGDGSASFRIFETAEEAAIKEEESIQEYGVDSLSDGVTELTTAMFPWFFNEEGETCG